MRTALLYKVLALTTVSSLLFGVLMAQYPSGPVHPYQEIAKIKSNFSDSSNISFDCIYFSEDIDTLTVRDTLYGYFRYAAGKYLVKMDSVEMVQDNMYNVTVNHEQQLIYVREPMALENNYTQVQLQDSMFMSWVDSISVVDSASFRILDYHFGIAVPYTKYRVTYDTSNYYVESISLTMLKNTIRQSELSHAISGYRLNLTIQYKGYSTASLSPGQFLSTRFIWRQNGSFQKSSGYTNYELINSTDH